VLWLWEGAPSGVVGASFVVFTVDDSVEVAVELMAVLVVSGTRVEVMISFVVGIGVEAVEIVLSSCEHFITNG
jgi:hypothetical protein